MTSVAARDVTSNTHIPDNEMEPECDQERDVTFVFDANNSFLHGIFPLKPIKVDKVSGFAHKKYVICVVAITWLLWRVMKQTLGGGTEYNAQWVLYCTISISIHIVIFIPWIVLVVLSLNKTAVNRLAHSFDFWIKLGNVILSAICVTIWRFTNNGGVIGLADSFLMGLYDCFLITFISSFDASNRMKRKWKIGLGALAAFLWLTTSLFFKFVFTDTTDYFIVLPLGVFNPISLQYMIGNYYQILAIFLVKQTINSIRKKEEAIAISINPIIKWRNQKQYNLVQTQAIEIKNGPSDSEESDAADEGGMRGVPRSKSTML